MMYAHPVAYVIHPDDNVATALDDLPPGEVRLRGETGMECIRIETSVRQGHKIALGPIREGESVVKYGHRIGRAVRSIRPGEWAHLHNVASDVDERSNTLDEETGAPTDMVYE